MPTWQILILCFLFIEGLDLVNDFLPERAYRFRQVNRKTYRAYQLVLLVWTVVSCFTGK